jgi:polar amino acid transport system ATP-binding protein
MGMTSPTAGSPRVANGGDVIVSFRDVVKRYGTHVVLDRLSFDVPRGQRLAIIGPSGSGKTTVLRCLMTLEPIDGGTITVAGTELSREVFRSRWSRAAARTLGDARSKSGIVFQAYNLFPHMKIIDNITVAPRHVLHADSVQAREQANRYLDLVGLADQQDKYPHQLSGGQQQRAAIARTLAMQPEILLLDEITSALDPELIGEVLRVVRRLADELGITMLIVTHEMRFAEQIADRVMFIEGGRIVEDGSPATIFHDPESGRTRRFLRSLSEYRE